MLKRRVAPRYVWLLVVLAGCAARPMGPPPGVRAALPFGAIDLDELHFEFNSALQTSLENSFRMESEAEFDADRDGIRNYDILALSGGGSRGAFGAGILCGWTESGSRPDFKVVTGVSTGALQATFAFLGSEYDKLLRKVFTTYNTKDLYRKRRLGALLSDAIYDTHPMKKVLAEVFDEGVIAAVAKKHRQGHRLFIGTVNLDTTEFIIWDMGKIAASGHPDAVDHYHKVLLASASIPVLFPPVYFEVEADGKTYHEMHVDGGTYANLCFRGFMLDFEDAMVAIGVDPSRVKIRLYIIRNGRIDEESERHPVPGRVSSIAATTIQSLFKLASTSAVFRAYVLASRNGIEFNVAAIPQDYDLGFSVIEFDAKGMTELFEFGYNQARDGYEWLKEPPFLDPDEVFSTDR